MINNSNMSLLLSVHLCSHMGGGDERSLKAPSGHDSSWGLRQGGVGREGLQGLVNGLF